MTLVDVFRTLLNDSVDRMRSAVRTGDSGADTAAGKIAAHVEALEKALVSGGFNKGACTVLAEMCREQGFQELAMVLSGIAAAAPWAEGRAQSTASGAYGRLDQIREAVDAASRSFVRTTPFVSFEGPPKVEFDIKDLLLLGAITQLDILLVGKTGTGKTKLATKVLRAIFGADGVFSKTTLPSTSEGDFRNLLLGKMSGSDTTTLQDAASAIPELSRPAMVLNEANRAPAAVQALLIPILDKEFEVQGREQPLGKEIADGQHYQLRVLTINEGEGYSVEDFDLALRDRAVLQIPLDMFPQRPSDVGAMVAALARHATPDVEPDASFFDDVVLLNRAIEQVPLDDLVTPFVVYLSGLSNCVKSPSGYKEGVRLVPSVHCHKCHHSKHFVDNLCGHIKAPSQRALVNLVRVSRGVALLRGWKQRLPPEQISVSLGDVVAIGPFILRGKLGLRQEWLEGIPPDDRFRGAELLAIKAILDFLRKLFLSLVGKPEFAAFLAQMSGAAEDEHRRVLAQYASTSDVWAANAVTLGSSHADGDLSDAPSPTSIARKRRSSS